MEIKNRITGEILNITEKNFYKFEREYELINNKSIYSIFELNDEFLDRFNKYIVNEINWNLISIYQILSKESIKKYYNYLNINNIIINQKLDSELLNLLVKSDFSLKILNWHILSIYQELDEDFIEQWKYYLDWEEISLCQKLSLNSEFIKKYKSFLVFEKLNNNITLIEKYKKEKFINLINKFDISNQIVIDKNIDYFLTYVGGSNLYNFTKGDYYIHNNLIKKLEIGKEIESENNINNKFSFIENVFFNRKYESFYGKDYYLAKVYYKDLFNLFQTNKITPIAKFSKGWKLKIE